MFRLVLGLFAGYVLGAKAGRGRYEQMAKAYNAVASNPAVKKVGNAGRQALANKISPEPRMKEIKAVRTTGEDAIYAPDTDAS